MKSASFWHTWHASPSPPAAAAARAPQKRHAFPGATRPDTAPDHARAAAPAAASLHAAAPLSCETAEAVQPLQGSGCCSKVGALRLSDKGSGCCSGLCVTELVVEEGGQDELSNRGCAG
jgi:hypothetical protein